MTVEDRFELLEVAGRGGTGTVWRAVDRALGRAVAIKVLAPGLLDDEAARARFRREARIVSKLRHRNLVRLYDVDRSDRGEYLVLEWVGGGSLESALRRGGVPLPVLLGWLASIARGVQAVHDAGVVHRDLKPANVLLSEAGVPKVVDFGLARPAGARTKLAAGPVAPSCMAPEQLADVPGPAGPRADVYALGAILRRMFADRGPPSGLEAIVRTATAADPLRRYATAADFAKAIESASRAGT